MGENSQAADLDKEVSCYPAKARRASFSATRVSTLVAKRILSHRRIHLAMMASPRNKLLLKPQEGGNPRIIGHHIIA